MELSEVLGKLRVDIGDPDATVFSDDQCQRALSRAVTRVNIDLGTSYAMSDTELTPDPEDEHLELLLLAAHANLAGMRRSTSASTGFSFQSGDKRVDKTKAASSWKDLWEALWDEYRRLVSTLTGQPVDDDILTPGALTPAIYEVDSENENGD